MKTQELVSIVPWTFIAQILNLFLQAYLFKKFLFKPINEVLQKRREKADAEIREAEEAKTEAEAIKSEYEQNMANARAQANEIVEKAQKTASDQSEQILAKAGEEARAIRAKAQADIEQEKKNAVSEMKNEISSVAMDIAGKVIEREINEEDHRQLIDEFLENVGEAS